MSGRVFARGHLTTTWSSERESRGFLRHWLALRATLRWAIVPGLNVVLKPSLHSDPAVIELKTLGEMPGIYTSFLYKNVVITLWFNALTLECIPTLEMQYKRLHEGFPMRVSEVQIMVPGGTRLPSMAARAAYKRLSLTITQTVVASAVVILGEGFIASALRSLLIAFTVAGSRSATFRIQASALEVVTWLPETHEQRTGVKIDPHELLSAIHLAMESRTGHEPPVM